MVISSFALMGFFVDTIPIVSLRALARIPLRSSVKDSISNIKFTSYVPSKWEKELRIFVSFLNTIPSTRFPRIKLPRRRIFENVPSFSRSKYERLCSKFVDIPLVKPCLLSRSPFRRTVYAAIKRKLDPQKGKSSVAEGIQRAKDVYVNSITTIIADKTKQRDYQRNGR